VCGVLCFFLPPCLNIGQSLTARWPGNPDVCGRGQLLGQVQQRSVPRPRRHVVSWLVSCFVLFCFRFWLVFSLECTAHWHPSFSLSRLVQVRGRVPERQVPRLRHVLARRRHALRGCFPRRPGKGMLVDCCCASVLISCWWFVVLHRRWARVC
jgi:hypothetical protein